MSDTTPEIGQNRLLNKPMSRRAFGRFCLVLPSIFNKKPEIAPSQPTVFQTAEAAPQASYSKSLELLEKEGLSDFLPAYVEFNRSKKLLAAPSINPAFYRLPEWANIIDTVLTSGPESVRAGIDKLNQGWKTQEFGRMMVDPKEVDFVIDSLDITPADTDNTGSVIGDKPTDEDVLAFRGFLKDLAKVAPIQILTLPNNITLLPSSASYANIFTFNTSFLNERNRAAFTFLHESVHALDALLENLKARISKSSYASYMAEHGRTVNGLVETFLNAEPRDLLMFVHPDDGASILSIDEINNHPTATNDQILTVLETIIFPQGATSLEYGLSKAALKKIRGESKDLKQIEFIFFLQRSARRIRDILTRQEKEGKIGDSEEMALNAYNTYRLGEKLYGNLSHTLASTPSPRNGFKPDYIPKTNQELSSNPITQAQDHMTRVRNRLFGTLPEGFDYSEIRQILGI